MFMSLMDGGFSPTVVIYDAGTGSDVVPAGATSCIIQLVGPGGNGGSADSTNPGFGGGGGGYCSRTVAVTGGQTFSYTVPAAPGSNATVSSGAPVVSMQANTGAVGGGGGTASPGIGGTASGGTVNQTGSNGSGQPGGSPGTFLGGKGNGGAGGSPAFGAGASGAGGRLQLSYS